MTRKDFETLAGVVRDQPSDFMAGEPRQIIRLDTERAVLAAALADVCAGSNPRFSHRRFFEACEVDAEVAWRYVAG